jgi:DNA polymerase-3 subunit epsilon
MCWRPAGGMRAERLGRLAATGAVPAWQRELPTFYYRQHFLELLDFVSGHYGHVLDDDDTRLVGEFRRLDRAAQCLYVRLANRKGRIFAANKLRYPEIGGLDGPLASLRAGGWIASPATDLFDDVLGFLTRREIVDAISPLVPGLARGLKKAELVQLVLERCEAAEFMSRLDLRRLLVQHRAAWVRFLLFLYFGEIRDGLSRFTLRDMGLVRTHSFTDDYEPRFADREEALETFRFADLLKRFEDGNVLQRQQIIESADQWPDPQFDAAATLRDRLAYAAGRDLEKSGEAERAMAVYRRGDSARCGERLVRLMFAAGMREEARTCLESMLDSPRCDEEWLFASDLYQRKFGQKRTTPLTDVLRAAETIELDEAHSGSPERAAIAYFQACGQRAYRAENALWRTLFGLLFWNELFASDSGALHSPFEALPSTLVDGSFYGAYRDVIESRLAGLADAAATRRHLLKVSTQRFGTANGVFRWRKSTLEAIFALLDSADHAAVAEMLRSMCRDYRRTRYGFPDLLVVDGTGPRFVEIKTEGDQLRRNQLTRLRQMCAAGLRADVVRVRWVIDPRQTYVVVDVETTGGSGDRHRVTELAAVKVRDGRIVERFQTLLNPQRPIPPGITRLTGISDEMVADAPLFADVAGDFEGFMQDAIFVAHNVNFDYGFISREFARLGRGFRYPKLCTCSSMRRFYPGLPSYSLGELCRQFGIQLRQHHRAMCDAEAAAELLLMVNEKRAEALATS